MVRLFHMNKMIVHLSRVNMSMCFSDMCSTACVQVSRVYLPCILMSAHNFYATDDHNEGRYGQVWSIYENKIHPNQMGIDTAKDTV